MPGNPTNRRMKMTWSHRTPGHHRCAARDSNPEPADARYPDVLAAHRRERARIRGEGQPRWGRSRCAYVIAA